MLPLNYSKNCLDDKIRVRFETKPRPKPEFSERLKKTLNAYDNRAIATQEVIEELLKLAKQLKEAEQRGVDLALNHEELAFYDALARNNSCCATASGNNRVKCLCKLELWSAHHKVE
jgi:type I restriction enzyme R subunit